MNASNRYNNQYKKFPASRFMGSKHKILPDIWHYLSEYHFESFLDGFSGSNAVGYFMKTQGKKVITNDFMTFSFVNSKAIIENSSIKLNPEDVDILLKANSNDQFVETTFHDIFFSREDNRIIDRIRHNIPELNDEYKRAIAMSALVRACIKKRSRGIFTFVGERYNDGRIDMSKSMIEHFNENISIFNNAVFSNGQNHSSYNERTESFHATADLVYFDPPYYSPKSDNDYIRRYHFVEGLVKNWEGLVIQQNSKVKKFESYKSPFSSRSNAYAAFENLFSRFRNSIIAISYSSNSLPTKDELVELLSRFKQNVCVHEIDHTYSFGNQNHKKGNLNNRVKEYLFIGS